MGWWLLILSCIGTPAKEEPLLHVNMPVQMQTFAIGSPVRKFEWGAPPDVRICSSTQVPTYRAQKALQYWRILGYKFGEVRRDLLSTCMNPRYGEIIITIPEGNFSNTHMAATRLYTSNSTGKIVKAKIFILPKNRFKERVLEHEIGHALGWSHYRQKYHMMHPSWFAGGYDSTGLHAR